MTASDLSQPTLHPAFFARVLQAIGVDADQFRALLRISLWIDFRGSAQALTGSSSTDNPLKGSLILYFVVSVIPAMLTFFAPVTVFPRAAMVFGMLLLTMILLVDFGVTLVVADDVRIIGWRPISSRTYLAARLANMLVLIGMFAVAVFLLPTISGAIARGSSPWFPLVFLPSALLAGVFVTGVIAAGYTALLRLFRPERFRGVLNAFQVGFLTLLILITQIGPHVKHAAPRKPFGATDPAVWTWMDLSPSNWFAAPAELLLRGPSQRVLALTALAIVSTIALFALLLSSLSLDYLERIAAVSEASPASAHTNRGVTLWRRAVAVALRSPEERVMFDFVRQIFLRDRKIRLRAYPSLAYAFVPGLIILLQSAHDARLTLLAPAAVLGMLPIPLLAQFPFWGESHGEWVFDLTGFESVPDLALGIKKAVFFTFQVPVLVLFAIPVFFLEGFLAGCASVVMALGVGLFSLELVFLLINTGLPFMQEFRAGSSGGTTVAGFAALFALGILGAIAYFFANTPPRLAVVGLALILASLALDGIGNARFTIDDKPAFRDSDSRLFS